MSYSGSDSQNLTLAITFSLLKDKENLVTDRVLKS